MGLTINTNLASLRAQRKLGSSSKSISKSFERLSSGLRIGSAADDAAGMSISTRMTAQIRGLGQAMRNANDGISLAQTAEGALQETTSQLQRVRELAVQAANDTNTASDRQAIQSEVSGLLEEIDRISQNTTFNNARILDGSFLGARFHTGANSREYVEVTVKDAGTKALARQARETGTAVSTDAFAAADVTLNGVAVRATIAADDTVSTANNDASSIAKAAAINAVSDFTGVKAIVEENNLSVGVAIAGGTLNSADNIVINGETITGFSVLADDADGELVNQINAVADKTGVVASLDSNYQLVLNAADGRNIEIAVNGGAAAMTGTAAGVTGGSVTLQSEEMITLAMAGAGAAASGFAAGVLGVSSANALSTVDVGSRAGANTAIEIVDLAIDQVSTMRSDLGAKQNRLQSTVSRMSAAVENASAARSRILDTDFATETAKFTRNQILQQASVAMLAQANQQPNIALSLL